MPLRICALCLLSMAARAQDQARLPYEMIYHMEKTETNLVRTFTNLTMFLRMTPTAPGVKISDVIVYIDSTNGRAPVPLNPTNGNFTVPLKNSLALERPWIVVNQPKGTMNFQWYVGLEGDQLPADGIHYRALMRPLQAVEMIRDEMAKIPGTPPLTISGLKMVYPKEKPAAVIVHSKSGDKIFKTDDSHALVVPLDAALLQEDPPVSIPVPPERVYVANPESDK